MAREPDKTAGDELKLFAENDAELYRQRIRPIQKNLVTKLAQSKYDHSKAPKLWQYMVDDAAKKYQKEVGGPPFDVATRRYVAQEFADEFRDEYNTDPKSWWERYAPKKYQKMAPKEMRGLRGFRPEGKQTLGGLSAVSIYAKTSPSKGWAKRSPGAQERKRMPARCFVGPGRQFPVCPKGSTKVDCAGLLVAFNTARRMKKTSVWKSALKKGTAKGCGWTKTGKAARLARGYRPVSGRK